MEAAISIGLLIAPIVAWIYCIKLQLDDDFRRDLYGLGRRDVSWDEDADHENTIADKFEYLRNDVEALESEKTAELVVDFASKMARKLRVAEEKYGYGDMWATKEWENVFRTEFTRHVAKGDPVDVANYCAFASYHGWSTTSHDRQYWVTGGVFSDTTFTAVDPETLVNEGPFTTYEDAYQRWSEIARRNVDNACHRVTVESVS